MPLVSTHAPRRKSFKGKRARWLTSLECAASEGIHLERSCIVEKSSDIPGVKKRNLFIKKYSSTFFRIAKLRNCEDFQFSLSILSHIFYDLWWNNFSLFDLISQYIIWLTCRGSNIIQFVEHLISVLIFNFWCIYWVWVNFSDDWLADRMRATLNCKI